MRLVTIENMSRSVVSVIKPELGVNRKWNKRGQKMALPFETVEQLLWDRGFRNLIDGGLLYIPDMKDKIELGLEPADATTPQNIIVLDDKKMENMWNSLPISVFKREVAALPKTQVDLLAEYAILHDIANSEKCGFIKELSGKDILVAISIKQEEARRDKAQAEREASYKEEGRRI